MMNDEKIIGRNRDSWIVLISFSFSHGRFSEGFPLSASHKLNANTYEHICLLSIPSISYTNTIHKRHASCDCIYSILSENGNKRQLIHIYIECFPLNFLQNTIFTQIGYHVTITPFPDKQKTCEIKNCWFFGTSISRLPSWADRPTHRIIYIIISTWYTIRIRICHSKIFNQNIEKWSIK